LVLPEIEAAAATLAAAGVASPRHDAEELAAHVLGLSRSRLVLLDRLPAGAAGRYAELVEQRAARVPLQHLTGVAGFRRLDLAVGPGVFVPRPETEVLVDWALARLRPGDVVVDLCAGSAAIALALADEAAGVTVHAVELEEHALAWAARNVAATGLPVALHRGDVADPGLLADLAGTVDLVTANPPYIPVGARIEREVAEHDPPAALWGGQDGLVAVRAVERAAARLLKPGGLVAVEHADVQGKSVPAVFRHWAEVRDHPDLAGRPRFTTARRPADRPGRRPADAT
jgi:release factor glutamine methyltransferase